LYECEKCKKRTIVYTREIRYEIGSLDAKKCLSCIKEELWLPGPFGNQSIKMEGRNVGYVVDKYYNKYGILLTAWGNREFRPKIDQDNLEMKNYDKLKKAIHKDADDGLISVNDAMYVMSRMEYAESMKKVL
jgi:hypothetical protein